MYKDNQTQGGNSLFLFVFVFIQIHQIYIVFVFVFFFFLFLYRWIVFHKSVYDNWTIILCLFKHFFNWLINSFPITQDLLLLLLNLITSNSKCTKSMNKHYGKVVFQYAFIPPLFSPILHLVVIPCSIDWKHWFVFNT